MYQHLVMPLARVMAMAGSLGLVSRSNPTMRGLRSGLALRMQTGLALVRLP
jgi:hypothetical protein